MEILTRYQSTLKSPDEQQLKTSIGKVSHIFRSELFQALLGKHRAACAPCSPLLGSLSWLCPEQPCTGSGGRMLGAWALISWCEADSSVKCGLSNLQQGTCQGFSSICPGGAGVIL